MREKFDTITGTGRAMTNTPEREHTPPIIFPKLVLGTISPYLKKYETSFSYKSVNISTIVLVLVLERAHFISSSSFIEFQTVEFQHVSSSTFDQAFRVLAPVIRVFQVFSSSSLAEFEF